MFNNQIQFLGMEYSIKINCRMFKHGMFNQIQFSATLCLSNIVRIDIELTHVPDAE